MRHMQCSKFMRRNKMHSFQLTITILLEQEISHNPHDVKYFVD